MNNLSTNHLSSETSPYLLQHADNPVEWHAWNVEALQLARHLNKPILLSIGYSACHWCHVMAHESFEDSDIAAIMNEHYVNIKVDREERPDLDKIYQLSHQLLTQRPGGWPLTVFLTPTEHTPFFAGTYFPKTARHGLPGFGDVLKSVANYFNEQGEQIAQQHTALTQVLLDMEPKDDGNVVLDTQPIEEGAKLLMQSYDSRFGGFGNAPKFPHPSNLDRLLRFYWHQLDQGNECSDILKALNHTALAMCEGGIYDQIGGGFCRYSVDQYWMIPHFEKMLYDNGPLVSFYSSMYQFDGNPRFAEIVEQIVTWLERQMLSPDGAFYAALDADSEGEEGKYYCWQIAQIKQQLSEQEYLVFEHRFGLNRAANFEGKSWHLHAFHSKQNTAEYLQLELPEVDKLLRSGYAKLLHTRAQRIPPATDDKILTAWNALMIEGLADAARVFNNDHFYQVAFKSLSFIRSYVWRDGLLLATCKHQEARLNGYLDDYALLIKACISMLQYRWDSQIAEFVHELADSALEKFEDKDNGGFFFTSHHHEKLFHRTKPFMDDAIVAGNGAMASGLLVLAHLFGEQKYESAVLRTLNIGWQQIQKYPHACNEAVNTLESYLLPTEMIIIRGSGEDLERWKDRANNQFNPRRHCFVIPDSVSNLSGILAEKRTVGATVAYICKGFQCREPITDFNTFDRAIS